MLQFTVLQVKIIKTHFRYDNAADITMPMLCYDLKRKFMFLWLMSTLLYTMQMHESKTEMKCCVNKSTFFH